MTQNATKGYIGSNSLNKEYSNRKSSGKGYLRKGYIAAILPALWVMGCNSGSTTTSIVPLQGVDLSVISHPNSTFYVRQTEGPKYEAIQVLNSSPYKVTLAPISLPSGVGVESNIAYYNSNTSCGTSGGVVLAESGGSCVLLLKSTTTTLGSALSTINISGSASNGALFSQSVNLSTSYTMYVGGEFSQIYGISASTGNNLLAQYNGNTWSDAVTNGDPNGDIRAITFDTAGNLYTGGFFNSIGGESITPGSNLLAVESTGGWGNAVANGQNANFIINAIAFDANDNLYVGGWFNAIGGVSSGGTLLAEESSGGWSVVANANSGIDTIAFDASGNLYTGGEFNAIGSVSLAPGNYLLAEESSGGWRNVVTNGNNATSTIFTIAFDASNNLYVGGFFESIAGVSATGYCGDDGSTCLLAKYDGSSWYNATATNSGVYNPNWGITTIAFDGNNNLFISGYFNSIGGITSGYNGYLLASRSTNNVWKDMGATGLVRHPDIIKAIAFGNKLSAVVVPQ